MSLVVYGTVFAIMSVLYIILRSGQKGEFAFSKRMGEKLPENFLVALKIIPAGLAAFYVILERGLSDWFYVGIALALVFCLLGDFGIEKSFLVGMGFFALAQLTFITSYLVKVAQLGFGTSQLTIVLVLIICFTAYVVFFVRFLDRGGDGLGEFKGPVAVYSILISGMVVATIFYLLVSNELLVILPVAGALSFVVSDSIIASREFRRSPPYQVLLVHFTYYLALFLISLVVLVG